MTDTTNLSETQQARRRMLIRVCGDVIGALKHDAELKEAARIGQLQARYLVISEQIEARRRENEQGLIPFNKRVEECEAALQLAIDQRAQAHANQGSLVALQNAAAELSKEIHSNDATYARVNNWGRPNGYVEEPAAPAMPDITKTGR